MQRVDLTRGDLYFALTVAAGTWHHTSRRRTEDGLGLKYDEHVSTNTVIVDVVITQADIWELAIKAFRNKSGRARRGSCTAKRHGQVTTKAKKEDER